MDPDQHRIFVNKWLATGFFTAAIYFFAGGIRQGLIKSDVMAVTFGSGLAVIFLAVGLWCWRSKE